jgi:hypothetical protein
MLVYYICIFIHVNIVFYYKTYKYALALCYKVEQNRERCRFLHRIFAINMMPKCP